MVACILARHGFKDRVIAAALVHDVLEDTSVSEAELKDALGEDVVSLVRFVIHNNSLPWEERKKEYIASARAAPEGAKVIVVADKIHNAQNLLAAYAARGPSVWMLFNRGRDSKLQFERAVLPMLRDTRSHPLIDEYEGLIAQLEQLT